MKPDSPKFLIQKYTLAGGHEEKHALSASDC